ncbi:MAG: hypothetical protein ABI145_07455 [Steroidobacteraceae bacterium]
MAEGDLRAAGLSRSKILAMKDICVRVNEGKIPSTALIGQMSDAEIYTKLLEARGVGMWTVDMLMIFALSRPHRSVAALYLWRIAETAKKKSLSK